MVGVAFWMFVAVTVVAGIVADYKKKRMALESLRAALERGQPLDPVLVEKLMSFDRKDEEPKPLHLQIGGIITTAAGVGVVILSFFIGQIAKVAFYPIMGGGIVTVCVGVGLLIAARVVTRQRAAATSGL